MTPSAVGLVLVEGQDADGPTMDRDGFEVRSRHRPSPLQTCEQAAAAVLRTEAIATSRGHRLHSIGVTWSDDADTEAALLLRSLTESGFDNVVPVRLPEATEALAWGIAEVIGHETTAVCVIEPETVIVLIVHTREGAVQTAVNRAIDSEEHLVQWLSAVFTRADWQPEALVVVGSGGDLEALMPWLEDVLSVPVFAPAEAELALARGAALASAHNADFAFADDAQGTRERHSGDRRRPLAQTGPLALLVAGVLTFVVSLSVAISLQLTPKKDTRTPEARPAANTSAEAPAAAVTQPTPVLAPPVAVPAPVADMPLAPPPEAPPVEIAPPPAEIPVSAPEAPVVVADAPPVDAAVPVAPAPLDPAIPPAAPPPPLPGQIAPPPVAPEPVERPGILRRLKDRLSDIGPDNEVPPGETLPPAPPAPLTEIPPPPPPP